MPQREKRRNREKVAGSSSSSPTLDKSKRRRREEADEGPAIGAQEILGLPGADALIDAITSRVAKFVNARLAAFEQRLPPEKIRPALQTDKRTVEAGKRTVEVGKGQTFAQVTAAASKGKEEKGGDGKGAKPKPSATSQSTSPAKDEGKKAGGKPKKATPVKSTAKTDKPQRAAGGSDWTTVERRSGQSDKAHDGAEAQTPATALKESSSSKRRRNKGGKPSAKGTGGKSNQSSKAQPAKPKKIRPPKQAAVLLSADSAKGGEKSVPLGEAISGIRSNIKLADFGITSLKPKKAAGGGILFEIPGQESGPKADKLAEALRALLEPKGGKIAR